MNIQLNNRKILFSLLAVIMCFGITAYSYGAVTVSIDPATQESPAVDEELTININIAGGEDIVGGQATVNYDNTALEYVSAAKGDYLPGDPLAGTFFPVIRPGDSNVTVGGTAINVGSASGDGTFATVKFKVLEVKASSITLSDVVLSNADATAIEFTTADGEITVPVVEEPTTEEPTTEEPTTEEPTTEEPTTEEPTTEEPTTEEPTTEEPTTEEPTTEEPTVEEPTTEEPTTEEPTVEEPTVEEPTPPVVPDPQVFKITLTNLTSGEPGVGGQIFSPPIFAAHPAGVKIYELGQPATEALVLLAEGGDTSVLAAEATAAGATPVMGDGFVLPGTSVTVMVSANAINSALSFATMLVSTNDAFIGVTDVALYDEAGMPITTTLDLMSYDAGSEQNTERASDIPGPIGVSADEDPEGSNARVPTEGGVITPHAGIMGVGEVKESFEWTEPTATLMIEPYVPEPDPEPEPVIPTYDVMLEAGLNMISVPLMPAEPYTAKSLAELVGATVVIKLDPALQSFVGYVVVEDDDGFGIEGGQGYIVNKLEAGMVSFAGDAWANETPETMDDGAEMMEAAAAPTLATLNNAWAFIVSSELKEMHPGMSYTVVAKNLRTGTVATEKVTSEDGSVSAVWADLNRKSVVEAGDKIEISLLDQEGTIVSGPFQRTVQTSDIHKAYLTVQLRVGDVRPQETILGQNFPNPFNPETWIPYQLSKDSNVSISIFNVSGHNVRSIDLGHKSVGSYMQPSTAAYWDGKNDAGEAVSSGIYFYTLQTNNFSATRRMVILK